MFSHSGFQLNYLELALESVVDPFFDFFCNLQFMNGEVGIEEAYIRTRSLPLGFQLKAGQFFSSLGRLNSQHDHQWSFYQQPLIYHTLFGDMNLNGKGLQLNWVAPLPFYLQGGVELFHDANPPSFANRDFTIQNTLREGSRRPVSVLFAKSSFDAGNLVFLQGFTWASGDFHRLYDPGHFAVTGDSSILSADLTVKLMLDSYRYLSLQAEWLSRTIRGDKVFQAPGMLPRGITLHHSGYYAELIFRFSRRWRTGCRYNEILTNDNIWTAGMITPALYMPIDQNRVSTMIEFNPSEFSRLRLQYVYHHSRSDGITITPFHELVLTMNMAVGAHGAHKF